MTLRAEVSRRLRFAAWLAAVAALQPARLEAQCPDGTPPPCGTRTAPSRRAPAQPLDERTWIVLPFENVGGVQAVEWLRDASANLLYLDLARWSDIRVVDDERVADMLRSLPAGWRRPLGLDAGMAVARRAGAGRLVMGDILRVGARTALVAKVYDVRGGQRIRSVREEATSDDHLLPAFSRLARNILNVPAAPAGEAGTVGTGSLAAYQEYIAGVRALNTWAIPEAESRFRRAIELDSSFALAHYKLRVVYGWEQRRDVEAGRRHAEAAARLGTGLPARERNLIAGMVAQTAGRWGQACEIYSTMLASDSTDVEAWYNLGECSFHDQEVVAAPGDTARVAFRSSWNTALSALSRTLALDPSYHLAYRHLQDILVSESRSGCRAQVDRARVCYDAVVLRDADSLVTAPLTPGGFAAARVAEAAARARRANLQLARENAARWVAAGPREWAARERYARVLLQLGDPQGALQEITAAAAQPGTPGERANQTLLRLEALLKSDRIEEAVRMADSALSAGLGGGMDADPAFALTVGKLQHLRSALPPGVPPVLADYAIDVIKAAAGVLSESFAATEQAFAALPLPPAQRRQMLVLGTLVAFRHRGLGPAHDTASGDPALRFQAYLAAGDTASARGVLAQVDSTLAALPRDTPDGGALLFSAESNLALGDSSAALERLRAFESRWVVTPLLATIRESPLPAVVLWGRTWLLHGDLAMAAGQRAEAGRAYRRVAELWSRADPEFQPMVSRARAALNQLQ